MRIVPLSPAVDFPQQCLLAPVQQDVVTVLLHHQARGEVCTFPKATVRGDFSRYLRERGLYAAYCAAPLQDITGDLFDGMVFRCWAAPTAPVGSVHHDTDVQVTLQANKAAQMDASTCGSEVQQPPGHNHTATRPFTTGVCTTCCFGVESDMLRDALGPFELRHLYADWTCVPNLPACTVDFLRRFPVWDKRSEPDACQIFVDGSWCSRTQGAAWAIAVLIRVGQSWCWAGFFSNSAGAAICADPLQITCRSAHDAEMYANVYALAVVVANRLPTLINFDCTSAAGVAQGVMQPVKACALSRTAVALTHLAARLNVRVAYAHVRSHQGHPLNEFVDSAAKAAATQIPLAFPPDSRDFADAVSSGDLFWLWLTVPKGQELPILEPTGAMMDDTLPSPISNGSVLSPLDFAPGSHKVAPASDKWALKLVTYNCLLGMCTVP